MRSQDILVFCFILTSCLVSCALSENSQQTEKRVREFIGKRDTAEALKNENAKADTVLNRDDFIKRVQEFIDQTHSLVDDDLDEDKRGNRAFLGKRDDEFDEEKRSPHFLGKRRLFLGKRGRFFLGKRAHHFLGKRNRFFLGKRDGDDEDLDTFDELEKRRRNFLGKRDDMEDSEFDDTDFEEMEKRRRNFLGKRNRNFLGR